MEEINDFFIYLTNEKNYSKNTLKSYKIDVDNFLQFVIDKLNRNKEHIMELYRMQDLGGCRVIVNSIDDVYKAVDKYKNSRVRHILKKRI